MTICEITKIISYLNKNRNVEFLIADKFRKGYLCEFEASVILPNRTVSLCISFHNHFPLSLPEIFINCNDYFGAHIGSDGKICLFDSSSVLVDQSKPDQLLLDCFDKAIEILSITPGTPYYKEEIAREFNSYWRSVSKKVVFTVLKLSEISFCECSMISCNRISIVSCSKNEAEVILRNNFGMKTDSNIVETKCLLIKIRDGSNLINLSKNYKWSEIRNYIQDNTSASIAKKFNSFLCISAKNLSQFILLVYPSKHGELVFGFHIHFHNKRYKAIKSSNNCVIENVFCKRIDHEYLANRGDSISSPSDKSVLLLGCGSVGGYIANNVCQGGITKLDILDNDDFKTENVYRHYMGFQGIQPYSSDFKADILKTHLEQKYPFADIDSLTFTDRSAETFLSDVSRLSQYDLIISALGEPTLNLGINKILYTNSIATPFICCFNEPYGIGGHVIVSNINKNSCLQCLYTDILSNELVPFRGSFVEPNQTFKKNVSGCASSFVPYSALDSQQTALLAARIAFDVLSNNQTENCLYSWFGESEKFRSQGFLLSEHYLSHPRNCFYTNTTFANEQCTVCRNVSEDR